MLHRISVFHFFLFVQLFLLLSFSVSFYVKAPWFLLFSLFVSSQDSISRNISANRFANYFTFAFTNYRLATSLNQY